MTKSIEKSKKKIVIIGGGTGVFTLLTGLKNYFSDLTAIVTMADDGGSTGILREDFGMLPPGDVRRALVALSRTDNATLARLFGYRFPSGTGLTGHSFGNLMLAALHNLTGNFEGAIREASKILNVEGAVVPVTLKKARLVAELEDGTVVRGESNIDIPKHDGRLRIKRLWLEPAVQANPAARIAILSADLVIVGPGDLYTSILPNILAGGIVAALKTTRASVLYVTNVMTKFGETNHFNASDFVHVMENHLGNKAIDYVLVNTGRPSARRLAPYIRERAELVQFDRENLGSKPTVIAADVVRDRGFVRHDPEKTARIICRLV